jgi:hypothetical protein
MYVFKSQEVMSLVEASKMICTARNICLILNGRINLLVANVATKEVKYKKITYEHATNVTKQKALGQAPCSIRLD